MTLAEELQSKIDGEVCVDRALLTEYSRDASIFQVMPEMVIYPKDVKDVQSVVRILLTHKQNNEHVALSSRSAGTDMSGGPLTDSVVLSFIHHINRIVSIDNHRAIVEPGMFYRHFEKETLAQGWFMPSYPASRELCAIGGIVMNNSGGEKTLSYGKTENYVESVEVVLSNGDVVTFGKCSLEELNLKKNLTTFEGKIYREMWELIDSNYETIMQAKPQVSKNSAGYYLWNVYDKRKGTFDLSKLLVGSQGTLGILTKATITGVRPKKYSRLLVLFLHDITSIAAITKTLLEHKPETLESYDDQTLKVAVRFFTDIVKHLKGNIFSLIWEFLPEFKMVLTGGVPKLIVMAEFTGDDIADVIARMQNAYEGMKPFGVDMRMTQSDEETEKYWTLRRESFNLLREKMHGHRTAPFIDDIVINPNDLAEFLPRLQSILNKYPLIYTIAGHVGNGNFHIIPLMDLQQDKSIEIIKILSEEVYGLIREFKGSITGEHNDGMIRTAFLPTMFSPEVIKLFQKTKFIFDPYELLNPGKKVGGNWEYAISRIDRSHDVIKKQTYMPC